MFLIICSTLASEIIGNGGQRLADDSHMRWCSKVGDNLSKIKRKKVTDEFKKVMLHILYT